MGTNDATDLVKFVDDLMSLVNDPKTPALSAGLKTEPWALGDWPCMSNLWQKGALHALTLVDARAFVRFTGGPENGQ